MRKNLFTIGMFGILLHICLSCSQDGEDPYALWQRYSHPDGDFSFYYMAPPFHIAPEATDAHPVLIVDAYDTPRGGGLDAKIRVEAWVSPRTQAEENIAQTEEWEERGYEVLHNLLYANHFGEEGAYIEVVQGEFWAKEVIIPYNEGSVILSAWTDERGSREDISLLVDSFRPGRGED